jgi:hypothetical protein
MVETHPGHVDPDLDVHALLLQIRDETIISQRRSLQ